MWRLAIRTHLGRRGMSGAASSDSASLSLRSRSRRGLGGSLPVTTHRTMFWVIRCLEEATTDTVFRGRVRFRSNSVSTLACSWLHQAASGLQQRSCSGGDSGHEPGIPFRVLHIFTTAGKMIAMARRTRRARAPESFRPGALAGRGKAPPPAFPDATALRMADCVGSELGHPAGVPFGHADSGGAAHHAESLCHAQRERRPSGKAAEHYPANSQPHPAFANYRPGENL